MEASAREVGMGETKGSREKKEGKGEEGETKKGENGGSKKSSGGMRNMG